MDVLWQQSSKMPAASSSSTSKVPSLNLSSVLLSSKDDAMQRRGSRSARELRSKPRSIKPMGAAARDWSRDEDKRHAATGRPEAAQTSMHSRVPKLNLSPQSADAPTSNATLPRSSVPNVDAHDRHTSSSAETAACSSRPGPIKLDYLAMAAAHRETADGEVDVARKALDDVVRAEDEVWRSKPHHCSVADVPATQLVAPRMVPSLRKWPRVRRQKCAD